MINPKCNGSNMVLMTLKTLVTRFPSLCGLLFVSQIALTAVSVVFVSKTGLESYFVV